MTKSKYNNFIQFASLTYMAFIIWALVGFGVGYLPITKDAIGIILVTILLLFLALNMFHIFLFKKGMGI